MIFDTLGLWFLRWKKKRQLRGVDVERPIRLLEEYRQSLRTNPDYCIELAREITGKAPDATPWADVTQTVAKHHVEIDSAVRFFEQKPFQVGGLDEEMDVIVASLCGFDAPSVMEIGVANGYSSAHLYAALSVTGGQIISVDMPRFSSSLGRRAKLHKRLLQQGKIINTNTLGDLLPGGVVPEEKYAGWLVPSALRLSVRNVTLYGNVFHVLPEIPTESLDVVVFDAMKPYDVRMKCFDMLDRCLKPHGVCFVDGHWVNAAFADFCQQKGYPSWTFGRVGAFRADR